MSREITLRNWVSVQLLNTNKSWRKRVVYLRVFRKSILLLFFANSQQSRTAKRLIRQYQLDKYVQDILFVVPQFTICEYVNGEVLGLPEESSIHRIGTAAMKQFGNLLARFHQRGHLVTAKECMDYRARWAVWVKNLLDWSSNHLSKDDYQLLQNLMSSHPPDARCGIVHGDVHVANVIANQNTMKLIDTTQIRIGFQEEDLARVLIRIPYAAHTDDQLKAFVCGYTQILPIDGLIKNALYWEIYMLLKTGIGRIKQEPWFISIISREISSRLHGKESIIERICNASITNGANVQ